MLNLSFNNIKRIEFLPPSLEELFLNGNEIDEVGINVNKPLNSLIHLGLSLNKIRQPALVHIVKVFPNLFCLDVSFNDICDMDRALDWITKLTKLRMLALEGNPLVLTPNYTNSVIERIPTLKIVDGNNVPID